jgi:hypothetical protein
LYNKAVRFAKESGDIWDKDACALAKAFKQALDALKHGDAIELPLNLKEDVDKSLHTYITWTAPKGNRRKTRPSDRKRQIRPDSGNRNAKADSAVLDCWSPII